MTFNRLYDDESNFEIEPNYLWKFFHYNSQLDTHRQLFYVPVKYNENSIENRKYNKVVEFDSNIYETNNNYLLKSIVKRKTIRDFAKKEIYINQIQSLIQFSFGCRTIDDKNIITSKVYPSAGARYPHELYLVVFDVIGLENGIYHYDQINNTLGFIISGDYNEKLYDCTMKQEHVLNAACILILTAKITKTTSKYGDRGYRYVLIDAGHIGQNICLVSQEIGLDVVPIGGFYDRKVSSVLDIGKDEYPIYIFSLG